MKKTLLTLTWMSAATIVAPAVAQTTTTYEDGPDGVKYQVTRQIVPQSLPKTELQTRQQKVYRPQVTTEYQSYQQTYVQPVTEYQYVPHLRNWWNPFTGAYWTHDLQPVTRWVARPATVQVPVAKTNWVEETQTFQVPVTTYQTASAEYITKRPLSAAPGGTAVASTTPISTPVTSSGQLIGGQQLQSDPPRTASGGWSSSVPANPYQRY